MSRIFISYERVDKEKVFKIKDQIESALDEKCCVDRYVIAFGDKFRAIEECETFIFMYSMEILNSENCQPIRELDFALHKKKIIILISLDGSELPGWLCFKLRRIVRNVDATKPHELVDFIHQLNNGVYQIEEVKECHTIASPKSKSSFLQPLKVVGAIALSPVLLPVGFAYLTYKGIKKLVPIKGTNVYNNKGYAYSSVFAPAEVKPKSRMMVQVYLHLNEETEKVKALATEADKNAERRDYIPLQTKLKKDDKVDVVLNINGNTLLYNSRKSIIWQGSFCKCAFDYLVPSDLDVDELSCSVNLYVNGAIVGEMLFYTQIVDSPAQLNANVIAKPVKKLFISYSHNDLKSAEKIAKLYEGMDVDVFFDKHRLKSGYIYSEEIFNFINKADTFVLCWSENAAQSEYVQKERKAALKLAYPNSRPREDAQISIKPYNIQPYATPPQDMIEHYHFEEL